MTKSTKNEISINELELISRMEFELIEYIHIDYFNHIFFPIDYKFYEENDEDYFETLDIDGKTHHYYPMDKNNFTPIDAYDLAQCLKRFKNNNNN
jgi:hypothetical protein